MTEHAFESFTRTRQERKVFQPLSCVFTLPCSSVKCWVQKQGEKDDCKSTRYYFMCIRLYFLVWKGWQHHKLMSFWFRVELLWQSVCEVNVLVILNGAAQECTTSLCTEKNVRRGWRVSFHWRTWTVKVKLWIKYMSVLERRNKEKSSIIRKKNICRGK